MTSRQILPLVSKNGLDARKMTLTSPHSGSALLGVGGARGAAIGQQTIVFKGAGQAGNGAEITDANLKFMGAAGATYVVTAHLVVYDPTTPPGSGGLSFVGGYNYTTGLIYGNLFSPDYTVEFNLDGTVVMVTGGVVSFRWSFASTATLEPGTYITYTRTA